MKFFKAVLKLVIILPLFLTGFSCLQGEGMLTLAGDDFFVRQGPGQCGPTSFYMIFRYYGDNAFTGEFTELPDCAAVFPLQEELAEVTSGSGVSRWLGVTGTGISSGELMDKISRLSADRNYPYYITTGDTSTTTLLRETRFFFIYNNFIKNDLPVIIHLSRPALSGHFMVLVGFDPHDKTVYYVDPNRDEDSPVVQGVGLSDFLNSQWYESPENTLTPYGYWDGTWIGFRHAQ